MFKNYVLIALRNLVKNKIYAAINVFGLAIGLTIYLFGGVMADYELNHDTMYANHERIYTVGSIMSPSAGIGIGEMDSTYTAMAPLLENDMAEDIEAVARTVRRGYVTSTGDKNFNEVIRFADPALLQIFDFQYIHGNSRALEDPKGLVLTRPQAMKMFGRVDVLGEVVMLNHKHDLVVKAVIEDMPANTHFKSSFIDSDGYDLFVPLSVLSRIADWDLKGNWSNLSMGNHVYIMTKKTMPLGELDAKLNTVFENHVDKEIREKFMVAQKAIPLKKINAAIWDAIGMPVISVVQILGALVLIIAIVNYTNLATAQSMGRVREVGMRKTLGAGRSQLLAQFLIESLTIAFISMVLSLVFLELIIPQFNAAVGRVVSLNYSEMIPWLIGTTVVVGLLAGAYPSYLITKVNPIDALKQMTTKGGRGSLFRSIMIGTQFVLSIFMLAIVMIVFFQNKKVQESSNIFPKDEVLTLTGLSKQDIRDKEQTLKIEWLKNPNITHVSFASQVPFEQSNNTRSVTAKEGDVAAKFQAHMLFMTEGFFDTFDIKLLKGRNLSESISADMRKSREDRNNNVIINEMMSKKLGFKSPAEAIGQSFYGTPGKLATFRYDIVGVVETQNILGAHNQIYPWIFQMDWDTHFYGAIRIKKGSPASVITEIEETWKTVLPGYPIKHQFLNEIFEGIYVIFRTMNMVLAGFAGVALMLALIGLFGLAAFMARGRTKEIGVRKVLGATSIQLVKLLIWQFSRPVMWAILIALPLSGFAAEMYLGFFADRLDLITMQIPLIIFAGVFAVSFAWGVIALHAMRVARSNPILALRYE